MRDRSGRIRLYPYRVVYIDAIYTPAQIKAPVPIFTDIIRAPNSEQAKKVVISEQSTRVLMFLTADRYPDNRARPVLAEFRKLTAYETKVVESLINATPKVVPVSPAPAKTTPYLWPSQMRDADLNLLCVNGFTVGKSRVTEYTSTAATFPSVAPPNHAQPRVKPVDDDWSLEDKPPISRMEALRVTPDEAVTEAVNDVFDEDEGIAPVRACEPDPVETFVPTSVTNVGNITPSSTVIFGQPDVAGIDAALAREKARYYAPVPPAPPKLNRFLRTIAFMSGVVHGYIKKPR